MNLPPRFPPLPSPLPWNPPIPREWLRIGLSFHIPFPSGNQDQRFGFRIQSFQIAKNAHALNSRYAHPLEANFVSGTGVSGCFIEMERFLEAAIVDGYHPHHRYDPERERQYAIQAQYEAAHGLPEISAQMLEAIKWEGWFTLGELRKGGAVSPALPYQATVSKLASLGARILTVAGYVEPGKWHPCGADKDLFFYEVAGDRIIEHLNPESPIADCGIRPGAWIWDPQARWNLTPCCWRLSSQDSRRGHYRDCNFFLDGLEIGYWTENFSNGFWRRNQLAKDLNLETSSGSNFECQVAVLKQVAPICIWKPDFKDDEL